MPKKMFFLFVAIFMFGTNCIAYAMMCHGDSEHSGHAQAAENAANVGNEICPITGERIVEKTKATYEHHGKIYNFCCPMCIDEFKKDPDKYAAKAEQDAGSVYSAHEGHHGAH